MNVYIYVKGIHQVHEHPDGYEPFTAEVNEAGDVSLEIDGDVVDDFGAAIHQAVARASARAAEETEKELRIMFAKDEARNPA